MNSFIAAYGLEEGVEARAPLYDRRVIEFALSRPIVERNSGGEQKLLVRHAMRDLLPIEVLAPRPIKTGTQAGYFSNLMRAATPLLKETLESSKLGDLGIVDQAMLQRMTGVYLRGGGDGYLGEQLFDTMQAELWLKAELDEATREQDQITPWSGYVAQPDLTGNGV